MSAAYCSEKEWDDAYDEAVQWRDWQECDRLLEVRENASWYQGPKHDGAWRRWFGRLLRMVPS